MKTPFFFLMILVAALSPLGAEEIKAANTEDEASTLAPETGSGAVASSKDSGSSEWQNWVFAGSAAVALTIGVLIVSLNTGHNH
jgi:hypothetical protein